MYIVRLGGLFLMLFFFLCGAKAQQDILMVINGEKVTCAEFQDFCLRKALSIQAIDSFIDYKLKVDDAHRLCLDTLSFFRSYMDSCHHSLSEYFLVGRSRKATDCVMPRKNASTSRALVSHIFQYIPQNATVHMLRAYQLQMDSLYSAIISGKKSFEEMVRKYSQEKESFWVNALDMPVEFEQIAFALPIGKVSAPFFTPQGIHVVRVLQREAKASGRIQYADRQRMLEMVLDSLKRKFYFQMNEEGARDFLTHGYTMKKLFSLDGKSYSGKDIASFVQSHPASPRRQLDDFICKTLLDRADYNLSEACPNYSLRMQSYSDSLLYQMITYHVLEEHLRTDTLDVMHFFEHNRKTYRWPETRFEGIVLHCVSKRVRKKVKKFLKKMSIEEWQDAIRLGVNADEQLVAQVEQGLFAPGDNRYVDEVVFKKSETQPVEGFPYVLVLGEKKRGPEHWSEIGDRFWDDYRSYRNACWIKSLRNKAKVEINQEVLKTVNNQ